MSWKFDPVSINLVWTVTSNELIESGNLDAGTVTSDLSIDTGNRSNDSSVLDQGLRVIDGSI